MKEMDEERHENLIIPSKHILLPNITGDQLLFALRMILGITLLIVSSLTSINSFLSIVLGTAAFLSCGYRIIFRAVQNLLNKEFFSENVLMSVAGIIAVIIGEITEGVLVMLLSEIGELLQDMAVEHSRDIITKLLKMRPDTAKLMLGDELREVSVSDLKVGDTIMVSPGERISADGVVTKGSSTIDTSPITGESMPRICKPGDNVLSGCINQSDTLFICVETEFSNSTVSRIVRLVEEAENKKGRTERLITSFSRVYTPLVFIIAVIIGAIVPLVGSLSFSVWIHRALILLVVSCPCAIVISVPLTYFAGIGGASKNGILFKNANSIDAAAKLTSVFFDKTGTLTSGHFSVTNVEPIRINKDELLYLASYAEAFSTHPIAKSILEYSNINIEAGRILSCHEEKGKGCIVTLDSGQVVAAGNIEMLESLGVTGDIVASATTSVYIAVDKTYVGRIDLSDTVKKDAAESVRMLKELGIENIALITGDNALAAMAVGKAVGITEVYSDCLPQDKVERLEYILKTQEKDDKLAFVGDGINDVPVLALADVGIAMGGLGSDAAIETADVVIMNDEPLKVPDAIKSAIKVRRIAAQNIAFSLGIKILAMVLGVCGITSMWMAVFADVGVTLLAIVNAMRAFIKS